MNSVRKKKMISIGLIAVVVAVVVALVLFALRQNISLFYSPTQIARGEAPVNHPIRVGGMVVPGTINRSTDDISVSFNITDYKHTLNINYNRVLPDLFREGQGVVALGQLDENGQFLASDVLAKHDEKYMPPEVRDSLAK